MPRAPIGGRLGNGSPWLLQDACPRASCAVLSPSDEDHPGRMSMTATTSLDRTIPDLVEDPYPWYARMRDKRLVAYTQPEMPYARMFRLSQHADVQAVLRDPRFGLDGVQQSRAGVLGTGELARTYGLWFLFMDPPSHTRLRALVSPSFTPRTVDGLRQRIQAVVDGLLDRQDEWPTFDLIVDFAYQVPVQVICEILGMPTADREHFTRQSTDIARGLDNLSLLDPAVVMQGNAAAEGLSNYFRALIDRRRRRPGSDLLSELIAAEGAGDRLTEIG